MRLPAKRLENVRTLKRQLATSLKKLTRPVCITIYDFLNAKSEMRSGIPRSAES